LLRNGYATVTQGYAIDIEQEIELDKEIDKNKKDIDIRAKNATCNVTENVTDLAIDFDTFYSSYPKKKKKQDAVKAWNKLKLTPELAEQIMSALELQKKSADWLKENGQFIPYPATLINGRRWEDEITTNNNVQNKKSYDNDGLPWLT
jgi:hypothetical protein